jgi:hypothetical protein
VYNIIAENIFQFILYSYFISHKTIIPEISRILNPAFFMNKIRKTDIAALVICFLLSTEIKYKKMINFEIFW